MERKEERGVEGREGVVVNEPGFNVFLNGEGERFGGIFYILNPSFLILPNKRNLERNKV